MKSYRNKKIYNFKDRHRRKKRTRSASIRNEKLGSAYTKDMQKKIQSEEQADPN